MPTFGRIHFAKGRATLLPNALPVLDETARALLANPRLGPVYLEGHADAFEAEAEAAAGLRLSARRAAAVRRYLVERGIDAQRLVPQAVGRDRIFARVADCADCRRVEIRLDEGG